MNNREFNNRTSQCDSKEFNNAMSYTKPELVGELLRTYKKVDDLLSIISLQELVGVDTLENERDMMATMNSKVIMDLMTSAKFRGYDPRDVNTIFKFGKYLDTKFGKPKRKKK